MRVTKGIKTTAYQPIVTNLVEYDSPADFGHDMSFELRNDFGDGQWRNGKGRGHWSNQQIRDAAINGEIGLVKGLDDLTEKIKCGLETDRQIWTPDIQGAFPVVPEALIGMPECMRTRKKAQSEMAPIKIYIDLVCSAGVNHDLLEKRGACYLALVSELCRVRPVDLNVMSAMICGGVNQIIVTKIKTDPLDIASAAHALIATSFNRALGYSKSESFGGGISNWAFDMRPSDSKIKEAQDAYFVELFGLGPKDLVIRGMHLYDERLKDPVAFVKEELRRVMEGAEDDAE